MEVTGAELARSLNLSAGRISQLVAAGRLDGTFRGEGRQRRFDLGLVQQKLKTGLHPGQMLGNGAQTKAALDKLALEDFSSPPVPPGRKTDTELTKADDDVYTLARAQKAVEEARKLRRQNEQEEGHYVLASEVERQVTRVVGQELREVETVLRDSARVVADRLGVDFKEVRRILLDGWRKHRSERSGVLVGQSDQAEMTEAEKEEDI